MRASIRRKLEEIQWPEVLAKRRASGETCTKPSHSQILRDALDVARIYPGNPFQRVYFARLENPLPGSRIKIGSSANLMQRMNHLGTRLSSSAGIPLALEPHAILCGGFELEQFFHETFKDYEADIREWFKPAPPILNLIKEIRSLDFHPWIMAAAGFPDQVTSPALLSTAIGGAR